MQFQFRCIIHPFKSLHKNLMIIFFAKFDDKTRLHFAFEFRKDSINLQLSKTVRHFCSSNGYFCKFIQQWRVAWIRVEMMTVPSGATDVSTSFSAVPRIDEERSLAKKMCGVQSESRNAFCPIIDSCLFGATSRKTNLGST